MSLIDFIRESNLIEGIARDPTDDEIAATERFLLLDTLSVDAICQLQAIYAPGMPIRERIGMNVQVGGHTAPMGGKTIVISLIQICDRINRAKPGRYDVPWQQHVEFELLHPFMDGNGRTGRAIWAWHMQKLDFDPFALPFLHRFYYQTLAAQR